MSGVAEERVLALVGRIYDAAFEPGQWQCVVEDLAADCAGTAAITTQDARGIEANISAASGIDPSFARSYELYYGGKRPWAGQVAALPVGAIFTPTALLREREYERTEYFHDWLRPQKLYHLSSCAVAKNGPRTTFLTLSRPRRAGAFGEAESRLVGALVPHLQRALALHRRFSAATQQRDLLGLGLEGLGVGAILVDLDGQIGFANRIAEDFLRRGDGLVLRQQRLHAQTPAATAALHGMIRGAARTSAGLDRASGGLLALPRADGSHLHALICPLPLSRTEGMGRPVPSALIFVSDAARSAQLRPGDLQNLYGLTRAEAALMSALASGKSLDAYAEAAGVSRTTAKTQLQHIFLKTGSHRQPELVAKALANGVAQIAARHGQTRS